MFIRLLTINIYFALAQFAIFLNESVGINSQNLITQVN